MRFSGSGRSEHGRPVLVLWFSGCRVDHYGRVVGGVRCRKWACVTWARVHRPSALVGVSRARTQYWTVCVLNMEPVESRPEHVETHRPSQRTDGECQNRRMVWPGKLPNKSGGPWPPVAATAANPCWCTPTRQCTNAVAAWGHNLIAHSPVNDDIQNKKHTPVHSDLADHNSALPAQHSV